jgi:hypothetical protein
MVTETRQNRCFGHVKRAALTLKTVFATGVQRTLIRLSWVRRLKEQFYCDAPATDCIHCQQHKLKKCMVLRLPVWVRD